MNILLVVIVVLLVINAFLASFAISFGNELKKKFGMLYTLLKGTECWQSELTFEGSMKTFKRAPHMRNVHIHITSLQPFFLAGFLMLGDDMADLFVVQKSEKENDLVVSLYVGDGPARIIFMAWYYSTFTLVPKPCYLYASADDYYQDLTPTVVIKPHWFQRGAFLSITSWVAKNFLGM